VGLGVSFHAGTGAQSDVRRTPRDGAVNEGASAPQLHRQNKTLEERKI